MYKQQPYVNADERKCTMCRLMTRKVKDMVVQLKTGKLHKHNIQVFRGKRTFLGKYKDDFLFVNVGPSLSMSC